jgi:hypothetical protein
MSEKEFEAILHRLLDAPTDTLRMYQLVRALWFAVSDPRGFAADAVRVYVDGLTVE